MFNKNTKRDKMNKPRILSSRFILTAILLLSVAIILIFMFQFNIISIPDYILNIFSENVKGGSGYENGTCEISDLKGNEPTTIIYEQHAENAYDVLSSLTESKIYRRLIRTIYSSDGETYFENATIIVYEKRFRIDKEFKTIVYDGEKLYIDEPTNKLLKEGSFEIFDQIGVTPLSYIKENASMENVYFKDPDNKKKITVVIHDTSAPIYNEYEISVENGLVLAERSYYNNENYRSIITDKIEIMDHAPPDTSLFDIPVE